MNMNKTVYAYSPATGAYTGPVVLDASDLSPLEDGVWLIPGDCLEVAPPTPPVGQYAAAEGGVWVLKAIYSPEPEPEPEAAPPATSISMRQARLALLSASLLDEVDASIAALPSPQREAAKIEWDYATNVERGSPMVALLSASVGLTAADLDALFDMASHL